MQITTTRFTNLEADNDFGLSDFVFGTLGFDTHLATTTPMLLRYTDIEVPLLQQSTT